MVLDPVFRMDHTYHLIQYCGVVYRDLKPENVLIGADGYPKLGDFAIAKRIDNDVTNTFTGTLVYMAPEVLAGQGKIRRIDTYQHYQVLWSRTAE